MLKGVKGGYVEALISEDGFVKTLRVHQTYVDETNSGQR